MELEEVEQLQPQSSEFMDKPNKGCIEANQSAVTQEPAPSELLLNLPFKKKQLNQRLRSFLIQT